MLNNEIMTQKPKQGYKFIYRYYDDDGSYIGQTKQSLKKRAGSMAGTNYTNKDSKFARAIIEKGFNHFNVEILCECLEEEADKKEEEYINQFDSLHNGYNSIPGGAFYFPGLGANNLKTPDILHILHEENLKKFKAFINSDNLLKTIVIPSTDNSCDLLFFTPYKNCTGIKDNNGILWCCKISNQKYEFNEETKRIEESNKNKYIISFTIFGDKFENSKVSYLSEFGLDDLFNEKLTSEFFDLLNVMLNPIMREMYHPFKDIFNDKDIANKADEILQVLDNIQFRDFDKNNRSLISILKRFEVNTLYKNIELKKDKYKLCYSYLTGLKDLGYLYLLNSANEIACVDFLVKDSYEAFKNNRLDAIKKNIDKLTFDSLV